MIGTDSPGVERSQNKATTRVLAVLSAFAADAAGYGVTELSNILGMTKNMVYRALTTLVEQGYLVRDETGQRYQLGFRILELQSESAIEPDLRALCRPYLRRVFQLTGETVSLMVRSGDFAVFIDGIETRRLGTYRMQIGGIRPLHTNASGRVLLAFSEDDAIKDYVARHRPMSLPTGGVLTPQELWTRVKEIRADGYACVVRPGALVMKSIAFPVWDSEGGLHGVLSTGGPLERFGDELERLLPELRQIMEELCRHTRLYAADTQQWEIA